MPTQVELGCPTFAHAAWPWSTVFHCQYADTKIQAGAFTVANLYYSHPILNILARDFDVPYVKVSEIPTLAQAGYAVGLLFLCPLGDMVERRPFVLGLVFFTATLR